MQGMEFFKLKVIHLGISTYKKFCKIIFTFCFSIIAVTNACAVKMEIENQGPLNMQLNITFNDGDVGIQCPTPVAGARCFQVDGMPAGTYFVPNTLRIITDVSGVKKEKCLEWNGNTAAAIVHEARKWDLSGGANCIGSVWIFASLAQCTGESNDYSRTYGHTFVSTSLCPEMCCPPTWTPTITPSPTMTPTPVRTITVEGYVKDTSGAPIEWASVCYRTTHGLSCTTTDSNGYYKLTGAADDEGLIEISFDDSDYVSTEYNIDTSDPSVNAFDFGVKTLGKYTNAVGQAGTGTEEEDTEVADPVDTFSGNPRVSTSDMKLFGKKGLDFELVRYYRKELGWYSGSLGKSWTHSYNTQILISGSGNISFIDPHGYVHRFLLINGVFAGKPNTPYAITKSGNYYTAKNISNNLEYKYFANETGKARLESIKRIDDSSNSAVITINYDIDERIEKIIDTIGREITFSYNGDSKNIYEVTAPGRKVRYNIERSLNTARSVTGPRLYCSYQYSGDYSKLAVVSENTAAAGYISVGFEYDGDNRVTKVTSPSGVFVLEYQKLDSGSYIPFSKIVRNPGQGQDITLPINASNKPLRTIVHLPNGEEQKFYFGGTNGVEKVELENAGTSRVLHINDTNKMADSVTDENGKTVELEYNSDKTVNTKTEYVTRVNAGALTVLETEYSYDSNGNVSQINEPGGKTTSYGRDSYGNVTSINRNGITTEIVFSNPQSGTSWTETTHINNSEDVVKTCAWNYSDENNISYTETIGSNILETVYDRFGRVKSKDSLGGTEAYTYVENSNGGSSVIIDRPGTNDITYEYDGRAKLLRTIDAKSRQTVYEYYTDDKVKSITSGGVTKSYSYIPYGSTNGGALSSVSGGGSSTSYQYHNDGKIHISTNNGITTSYSYSSANGIEEKTVTDNEGNYTIYTSNQHGQVLKIDYPGAVSGREQEYFEYDVRGNRTKITDKNVAVTNFQYDYLNRLTKMIYADNSEVSYAYDDSGNMISKTDPINTTTYTYDAYNRLLTTRVGGVLKQTLVPSEVCTSCNGMVGTETNEDSETTTYDYTNEGWLKKTLFPDGVTIENEYDQVGALTWVKLNDEVVATYEYDSTTGRLKKVTDKTNGADKVYNITYNSAGLKTEIAYPNNTAMRYAYDAANRIASANGIIADSGSVLTKNEVLARDGVGNIEQKNINTGTVTYGYDNIYQLTSYSNPVAEEHNVAYSYDAAGNRLSVVTNGTSTFTYEPNGLNQYDHIGSVVPVYDANGNMTQKGGSAYSWDYKNRMVGAAIGSKAITYKYNNKDIRKQKDFHDTNTNKNVSTRYYYNGTKLLAEKEDTGSGYKLTKIYTTDNEGVLGMTRVIDNSGTQQRQNLYYLFDELGSVTAITNSIGAPLQYYLYDAYGNLTSTETDPINTLAFVGRYFGQKDWDTNLTYFWHRWYDGKDGRWVSRDPIGVEGGMNIYGYVSNGPVTKTDRAGLTCPLKTGPILEVIV